MIVTQWFNFNTFPVRPGLYEVKSHVGDDFRFWRYFDGKQWYYNSLDKNRAMDNYADRQLGVPCAWRGLAVKP